MLPSDGRDLIRRVTAGRLFAWSHELCFPSLGVSYTYIPKNGCSSFKLSLGVAEGWLDDGDDPHSIGLAHRLQGKIRTRRPAVRFVVLRDPASRVASAYLDRFSKESDHTTAALVRQRLVPNQRYLDSLSFDEFVALVAHQEPKAMDPHWRPQTDFLRGRYTHMIDFRNIEKGFDLLRARHIPIRTYRPHTTSEYRPLDAPAGQIPAVELRRLRSEKGIVPTAQELISEPTGALLRRIYATDYTLIASAGLA